jgi:hypothetical protein
MPITFDFAMTPGVGNLGPMQTVSSLIASLPNYNSFFVADDAPPGRISEWPSIAGSSAIFSQGNDALQPMRNTRDGRLVVDFDGAQAMSLNGLTIGTPSSYTIGVRFFQKDYQNDAQVLFGYDLSSPTYRLMSRFANADHFFRMDSDIDISAEVPDVDGWHTAIICQGGGQMKLSIDGTPFQSVSRPNANLPSFHLGNGRGGAGSGHLDIRAVSLHRSDLSNSSSYIETLSRVLEIA